MEVEIKEFGAPMHRGPQNEIEKTLAKEVRTFWKEKTFCDVDIHCGLDGGVIQSHCLVLASLSPVFKSVLRPIYDNYTDNERAVLIIPGIHSSKLTNFLNDVYTGSACEVSIDKELQFLKFTAEIIHETFEIFEPSKPSGMQNRQKGTVFELDRKTNENCSKSNNSCIWEYYSTVDKKLATCDDCSEAVVVAAWGDLSELTSHLKTHHPKLFKEFECKVSKEDIDFHNDTSPFNTRTGNRKRKRNLECQEKQTEESLHDGKDEVSKTNRAVDLKMKDEERQEVEINVPKRRRKKRRGRRLKKQNPDGEEVENDEPQKSNNAIRMRKEKRSLCWRYFSSISGKQAQCNKCQKLVLTLGGSTTIMSRHLTKHHPDIFSEFSKLRELQVGQKRPAGKIVPTPKSDVTLGPKSSVVWDFFVPAGPEAAKCHICEQEYVIGASSGTSQLLRHIMKEHEQTYTSLKEKRQQIEGNIMLCSMHHPMWKYYTELENNQYSCNQCNGEIIIKSDTLLVKPLEEHLEQAGHHEQWKEYSETMARSDFVQKLKHAIR